jgi:hypothetical protein
MDHNNPEPELHKFAFDLRLIAALRVKAPTLAAARELITKTIDAKRAELGEWPNGDPIIAEVSVADDEPISLFQADEIDAESSRFVHMGRVYDTIVFENANDANTFMEGAPGFGVLAVKDGQPHVAHCTDQGEPWPYGPNVDPAA